MTAANGGITPVLFEAIGRPHGIEENQYLDAATPKLVLRTTVTYANGKTTFSEQEVQLNLHDFTSFYTRYDISNGQQNNLDIPFFATPNTTHESKVSDEPFLGGNENVVFVHGYNVVNRPQLRIDQQGAQAETTFKRLYWQGFRGEFIAFNWPGYTSLEVDPFIKRYVGKDIGGATYNPSDFQAYRSGNALKEVLLDVSHVLDTNPANHQATHLIAHSQGNVVAGEALRLYAVNEYADAFEQWIVNPGSPQPGPLVESYSTMSAAISAGQYGANELDALATVDLSGLAFRTLLGQLQGIPRTHRTRSLPLLVARKGPVGLSHGGARQRLLFS